MQLNDDPGAPYRATRTVELAARVLQGIDADVLNCADAGARVGFMDMVCELAKLPPGGESVNENLKVLTTALKALDLDGLLMADSKIAGQLVSVLIDKADVGVAYLRKRPADASAEPLYRVLNV